MTRVSEAAKLYVPAGRVWEIVGDFVRIDQWHPAVREATAGADGDLRLRTLETGAGEPLVERLEDFDEEGMAYSYTLISGPLPVRTYKARIQVKKDNEESCTVEWNGAFEPDGVSENEAVEAVRSIYLQGLEHLRFALGG